LTVVECVLADVLLRFPDFWSTTYQSPDMPAPRNEILTSAAVNTLISDRCLFF
jgi:hypothetical protein